jgi:hypothetical protein
LAIGSFFEKYEPLALNLECGAGRSYSYGAPVISHAVMQPKRKHMKKIILLNFFVSVILFCFGCQENSSEPESIILEESIKVTGQIISNNSTSSLDSIKIMLVGEITYSDTTDNQGFFEFLIEGQDTFHLIVNSEGFKQFDSVFVIISDTSITIDLQPILYDYFPLNIGNSWEFTYNLRDICSGDNIYVDGIETWEITDLEEASNDSIIYKCKRYLNGIKIDARGPDTPDTSAVNISDDFIIVEDEEQNILINHPNFKSDVLLPRFYTKDFPDEILYESTEGFIFIYRYKKQIGLTFWQQTTGSGHCNTTITWSLTDSFIH